MSSDLAHAATRRRMLLAAAAAGAGLGAASLIAPEEAFASAPTDWYNVKADYGARGDGVTDDTTAIQNALTAAGGTGGTVYFPPGTYVVSAELVLPNSGSGLGLGVELRGNGPLSTVLSWQTDLGSGHYAVRCNSGGFRALRDLGLSGPGTVEGIGTPPCDMSGLLSANHLRVSNVRISNFYAGVEKVGDHQVYWQYESASCYYGVYMTTQDAGAGNVTWYDCILDGTMAAVAVEGSYAPNDETFIHCHLHGAPYGIYGESGSSALMIGFLFYNTSWEGIGNAMIGCGSSSRKIVDCVFHRAGFTWDDAQKLSGAARNAAIETGDVVDGCRFEALDAQIATGAHPQAALVKAAALSRSSFPSLHGPDTYDGLRSAGIPFYTGGGVCDANASLASARYKILQVQPGSSCAQDTFATFIQFGQVLPYGQAGVTLPAGVICNAGGSGDGVLVCVEGLSQVKVAGTAVSQRDILVPDATTPTKAAPGSATSRSIMGYASDAGPASGTAPIWVRPQF